MNLSVSGEKPLPLQKKLFKLKPEKDNGFILKIHYKTCNRAIRFIHSSFHEVEYILAAADKEGHVYIIDFMAGRYWGLPKLNSCSFIKFSPYKSNEILVGKYEGVVDIIDIDLGCYTAKLFGHKSPVNNASFAEKYLCLTWSQNEAIVWDLRDNTKLQVLSLQKECALKFVSFIPVLNHILACFQDDIIQIWKSWTYENLKQFLPSNWNNYSVKSLAFSRNGKIMIVGGYLPTLAIFLLDSWKLLKLISLPKEIQSVKHLEFVSTTFDGGSNRILIILSGKGIVYIYDLEENVILSELKSSFEINKIECSYNGRYISCLSCSGEIEIYNLSNYTISPKDITIEKAEFLEKKKIKLRSALKKKDVEITRCQIKDILNIEQLKSVLKEYGQFPSSYRMKIWENLLKLPNNTSQYNSIINNVTLNAYDDLYEKFPLENKNMLKSLKMLLNNIVTWCPFFGHVEYLPFLVFPFVKLFQNRPLVCFEAVCTIIVNWCQHWFEYYPLPPMNILAIIENTLLEHDPDLLQHFHLQKISFEVYAWNLLESSFSEVLTETNWLQLWDHILINEPSFLLCAVVSYNILNRKYLFALEDPREFDNFFQNQNPVEIKKLISKTYCIFENTSEKIHPRQYLEEFKSLDVGVYPNFVGYPKAIVEFEDKQTKNLESRILELKINEDDIIKEKGKTKANLEQIQRKNEEESRVMAMEKACMEKLKSYQNHIQLQQEKLKEMRNNLEKEEKEILETSKKKVEDNKTKKREGTLQLLQDNIDLAKSKGDHDVFKVENELSKRFLKMLQHKNNIQNIFNEENENDLGKDFGRAFSDVQDEKQKLSEEIEKIKGSGGDSLDLKKLNIATSIAVMEELIMKIELELVKQNEKTRQRSCPKEDYNGNIKVWALQNETNELGHDVSKLLKLLNKTRKSSPPTLLTRGANENLTNNNNLDLKYCDCKSKCVRFSSDTTSSS